MPPPITNIVVLMLENRSYDNVLGMLYNANNPPPYNQAPAGQADLQGLTGSESNPVPKSSKQPAPPPITVQPATGDPKSKPPLVATTIPAADPGEPFLDMAQQIMGLTDMPTASPYRNADRSWAPPGPYGSMGGFVANYSLQNNDPVLDQIMMYLTPEQMPVTAFLANNFMVCDEWFGSVPTQTFANRLYSLCADAGSWTTMFNDQYSYIDDSEYLFWNPTNTPKLVYNDSPPGDAHGTPLALNSIFKQLDTVLGVTQTSSSGTTFPSWKVYFHDYSLTANLLQYVKTQFLSETSLNIGQYDNSDYQQPTKTQPNPPNPSWLANASYTTFSQDLAAGTLASFTVIEPRYSNNYKGAATGNQVNCNHPGLQGYPPNTSGTGQIDAFYGELLLLDIYTQLYNSAYWPGTLLIVTYDEHGGCYDHLPPVFGMAPPSPSTPSSHAGFDFTVSGPRVPTLIISPFAPAGSTLRASSGNFDHTSIVRTVWDAFNLDIPGANPPVTSLTQRDATAASILDQLNDAPTNNPGIPPMPVQP